MSSLRFTDIDISDITTQLSNELAIFEEFRAYKDYKAPDKAIIEHLLWIKFSDDVIMLKGAAGSDSLKHHSSAHHRTAEARLYRYGA